MGIARALATGPEILLCDEATSALDPETTHSILQLLRDINRKLGITVVLITHEMSVIREIADQVLVLEQGRIAELGAVWQVFGNPQHAATRALLAPLQHGLPDDLHDAAIAHAIIALGRSMNLTVIAEGVETKAQEAFLALEGCEQIQGFVVSRALTSTDFSEHFLTPKAVHGAEQPASV